MEAWYGKKGDEGRDSRDERASRGNSLRNFVRFSTPRTSERRSETHSRSIKRARPNDPNGSDDDESVPSETETKIANIGNDEIKRPLKNVLSENERLKKKTVKQAWSGYEAQAPKTYIGEEADLEE
ncbi:hypothetical protein BN14_08165 [Rhizoctonia solani AG-1 IB]|uniref:Uncharacterized protein n=1 Tax=Thanatephorus cucumeris (strain AG1-IB / isolate 7/3/14) TaxID=1108050 RepID=M5C289_THACB|nr:hypothetical protein BN14_08165 [Rhizoctonia solani AG-1 IB]